MRNKYMIQTGNWIKVDENYYRIPDDNSCYFFSSGKWGYSPIPITKEILIKNGFICAEVYTDVDSYFFCYSNHDNDYIRVDIYHNNTIYIDGEKIEYVHELQNYCNKLPNNKLSITL